MTDSEPSQTAAAGRWLAQPINRLLVLSFVVVAVVPLLFIGVKLYRVAWADAWREIYEKHRLLAMNLAAPLSNYVNDHRADLALLASELRRLPGGADLGERRAGVLQNAKRHLHGFQSLTLVDRHGATLYSTDPIGREADKRRAFASNHCFRQSLADGGQELSGVQLSPLTGRPTLILSQAVAGADGRPAMVLLAELRIDLIEKLRRNIRFGKRGHSAIVDQYGHVIAHPNPQWMLHMRDLSKWPIVKDMMAGKTGVTEFYSPFVKQEMVAGYAAVPGIGWGVMVPQPKSEVEARVHGLLYAQFGWGLFGLGLALALAVGLTRWIAAPLNRLAGAALELMRNGFHGTLPAASDRAPREVRQLSRAFDDLVGGLQESRSRFDQLNRSLQQRVDEATNELRQANVQLERLARQDHLTRLANRRYFEDRLAKSLKQRRVDDACLCLVLIDIDNFKQINDEFGHAAGDALLVQLSTLLLETTRQADLVARYGGDEFVVNMQCDREIGHQRAADILAAIEQHEFRWGGNQLQVTVSIGLLCHSMREIVDSETLLMQVDKALYRAKDEGRNRMVEVQG
jgi:diguanylate cyclase (GGDEF)-like protein